MYEKIFEKFKYTFNDVSLLERAFTHSSYAHEQSPDSSEHNERLEFLGDAVLEVVISELLYKRFPEYDEGQLTKFRAGLVCEASLAKTGHGTGIEEYLRLGRGEEGTGGRFRDALLADAFEAVIGALFLDGGFERAQAFIYECFDEEIGLQSESFDQFDNKTFLQESFQKNSKIPLNYVITDESGPDHNKTFTAKVRHNGKVLGVGSGRSKKEAEQSAASEAIKKLGLH
ncbi:MAG: ribonuclease III [Clostridiales bacterium]|jgi:ribonuclease-3|nr:ribonuclease III [Clostridiales bacterium]